MTIEMEDYGGFEKVGPLGTTLTRNDTQITTEPGDVILYQGNQITIYYGTNSWSFTRLARIDDPSGLQEKLGEGAVRYLFACIGGILYGSETDGGQRCPGGICPQICPAQ
ncbi:MAG: cyclophilin-like fold protein [Dysosmobacter sp.]